MSIRGHYYKACEMASSKVEQMARTILRNHPHLDEFIMAMGSYSFTTKTGGNIDPISSRMNSSYNYVYYDTHKYLKPLNDFIGEWDQYLKITGEPMRFTATGKKITDW